MPMFANCFQGWLDVNSVLSINAPPLDLNCGSKLLMNLSYMGFLVDKVR